VGHLSDEKKLEVRILHGDGTNTVAKKRAMGSLLGYTHQTGEKVIAMTDKPWRGVISTPVAPVNETDMVLSRRAASVKKVATQVGLDLRDAMSISTQALIHVPSQCMFNAGMIPNITENHGTGSAQNAGESGYSMPLFMP